MSRLGLALKKSTHLFLSKLGVSQVSQDVEFDTLKKEMDSVKKSSKRMQKHLETFVFNYTHMMEGITQLFHHIHRMFEINEGIGVFNDTNDPKIVNLSEPSSAENLSKYSHMLKIVNKMNEMIAKLTKDSKTKLSNILSFFTSSFTSLNAGIPPIQREIPKREEKKIKFDQNTTSCNNAKKKLKKSSKSSNNYKEIKNKYKNARAKLDLTLSDYNHINKRIKSLIVDLLENSFSTSRILIVFVFKEYSNLIVNTHSVISELNNLYINNVKVENRIKKKISRVTCHILEDNEQCSTIISGKLYLGNSNGGSNLNLLQEKKIKTIINCNYSNMNDGKLLECTFEKSSERKIKYYNLTINDDNFIDEFNKFNSILNKQFRNDHKIEALEKKFYSSENDLIEAKLKMTDKLSEFPIIIISYGGVSVATTFLICYYIKERLFNSNILLIFKYIQRKRRFVYLNKAMISMCRAYKASLFNSLTGREPITIPKPKDVVALRFIQLYLGGLEEIKTGLDMEEEDGEGLNRKKDKSKISASSVSEFERYTEEEVEKNIQMLKKKDNKLDKMLKTNNKIYRGMKNEKKKNLEKRKKELKKMEEELAKKERELKRKYAQFGHEKASKNQRNFDHQMNQKNNDDVFSDISDDDLYLSDEEVDEEERERTIEKIKSVKERSKKPPPKPRVKIPPSPGKKVPTKSKRPPINKNKKSFQARPLKPKTSNRPQMKRPSKGKRPNLSALKSPNSGPKNQKNSLKNKKSFFEGKGLMGMKKESGPSGSGGIKNKVNVRENVNVREESGSGSESGKNAFANIRSKFEKK